MSARAKEQAKPWWTRPAIVLPAVGGLAFVAALFSPSAVGPRSGDPRLSTLSTEPLGASIVHELAQRLGWTVERRLRPGMPTGPDIVQAVLDPAVPLRTTEAHALLEHVRAGGGALVVVGRSSQALMDSLHIRLGDGGRAIRVEGDDRKCISDKDGDLRRYASLWFGAAPQMLRLQWTAPAPGELETFLYTTAPATEKKDKPEATMVGFAYGAGRIVVSVDADVFRNDAVRECEFGFDVATVRALEYLRDGGTAPRLRLVFDEYHQAHGAHPCTISAAAIYLGTSPSGRLLAQLALAGIVLLVALAPRIVPPREDRRLERRSPLEQVEALARAYEQVGATRTAAERLVRGVRRRSERGAMRDRQAVRDDAWLERVAERSPSLREDVALVRRALSEAVPPRTFATLGPALHRIEATLTRR